MSISVQEILEGLNEAQRSAVSTTEGRVFIVAGPGTGKTLTIVRRIAYLVQRGIAPGAILAVTFTNRAAAEMRKRAEAFLGAKSSGLFIGTFHLLGLKIIQDTLPDNFTIYNKEEQLGLIKELLKDSGSVFLGGAKKPHPVQVAERISRIKNLMEEPDEMMTEIYKQYQRALLENAALDFDDLILRPIEMLGHMDDILRKYRDTFRYIMVDEYQDINPAQYKLLKLLSQRSANLCVIGDSDQAIYAFRGADAENFLHFDKDFEGVKKITFSDSYRSTGVILRASDSLIKNNSRRLTKELKATREKGISIIVASAPDDKAEGEIILREIEERMGCISRYQEYVRGGNSSQMQTSAEEKAARRPYCFSDFAVIFRTNAQAKVTEQAFRASGIPYQVIGGKYALKRKGIENLLSFLSVLNSPSEDLTDWKVRGLQEMVDMELLEKFRCLKDTMPLHEFLRLLGEESAAKKWFPEEYFLFLEEMAIQYRGMSTPEAIDRFIDELRLLRPEDDFDSGADAVALMTLHMAKGLEFRVVFIAGVEEGFIPYTMRKDCDVDIEEERRLFYVGMTRAMDELFLVCARQRSLYGQRLDRSPSPFLKEIPEECLWRRIIPDRRKEASGDVQMGLF